MILFLVGKFGLQKGQLTTPRATSMWQWYCYYLYQCYNYYSDICRIREMTLLYRKNKLFLPLDVVGGGKQGVERIYFKFSSCTGFDFSREK